MSVKKVLGKIRSKEKLTENTWILRVEFSEKVEFVPGQFVSLKVNKEGLRRAYSVASLPYKKSIELVVDVSPMGVGSKYVLSLREGDKIEILGFLGSFVVDSSDLDPKKTILFVSTGVGVIPLRVMIEDLLVNKKFKGQIYLVWGMRNEGDLFWHKEIEKLERDFDNFHFEMALSKPGDDWQGKRGHVGEVIDNFDLKWREVSVYLCGNPEMISEMKNNFVKKGVSESRIFYERFA